MILHASKAFAEHLKCEVSGPNRRLPHHSSLDSWSIDLVKLTKVGAYALVSIVPNEELTPHIEVRGSKDQAKHSEAMYFCRCQDLRAQLTIRKLRANQSPCGVRLWCETQPVRYVMKSTRLQQKKPILVRLDCPGNPRIRCRTPVVPPAHQEGQIDLLSGGAECLDAGSLQERECRGQ